MLQFLTSESSEKAEQDQIRLSVSQVNRATELV